MLAPELIERLKHEREERERPCQQIPLYVPEMTPMDRNDEEEKTESRCVVIDLV